MYIQATSYTHSLGPGSKPPLFGLSVQNVSVKEIERLGQGPCYVYTIIAIQITRSTTKGKILSFPLFSLMLLFDKTETNSVI